MELLPMQMLSTCSSLTPSQGRRAAHVPYISWAGSLHLLVACPCQPAGAGGSHLSWACVTCLACRHGPHSCACLEGGPGHCWDSQQPQNAGFQGEPCSRDPPQEYCLSMGILELRGFASSPWPSRPDSTACAAQLLVCVAATLPAQPLCASVVASDVLQLYVLHSRAGLW